jgi:hypothetical protein
MPLNCSELPTSVVDDLNICLQSSTSVLAQDCATEAVYASLQNGHVIFASSRGFYFLPLIDSIENTIHYDIKTPRNYLCTVYEVLQQTPELVTKLLDGFQERHGARLASQIQTVYIKHEGTTLLLVKLPSALIRHLMAPSGGVFKTFYKGPLSALKTIPMLQLYGNLPKRDGNEIYTSVFVTSYNEDRHIFAQGIHYMLLQDVLNKPNAGITLTSVGQWDAD